MVLCQNGDGVPLYYTIVGRTGSRYPIVAERGMNMHIEVEQKFRAEHSTGLLAQLERLGAVFAEPIVQVDQYFAHPARDFAQTDEALRIRRVGERNFVTYKGPKLDATTKTRRELELPLTDGAAAAEQFAELLTALGFSRVREVRKSRQAAKVQWRGQEIEIALDDVDRLGQFVELEIVTDSDGSDAARGLVASLAAELGLKTVERRSYLELLLAAAGSRTEKRRPLTARRWPASSAQSIHSDASSRSECRRLGLPSRLAHHSVLDFHAGRIAPRAAAAIESRHDRNNNKSFARNGF